MMLISLAVFILLCGLNAATILHGYFDLLLKLIPLFSPEQVQFLFYEELDCLLSHSVNWVRYFANLTLLGVFNVSNLYIKRG